MQANESKLHEKDIQAFIDITVNYFSHSFNEEPSVGIPYLKTATEEIIGDFTGIIGISGERKGCIYITAPEAMLAELLKEIGEEEATVEILTDMVGEIANTISGNVRNVFGSNFMISVPISIAGKPENIKMPQNIPIYVVPISWKKHKFYLVLGIE